MGFGKEIKRLREDAGISVAKLAKIIGVNQGRLSKWEEKDFTPRFDDATIIEAFFGMSIAEICQLKSIKKFLIVPRGTSGTNANDKKIQVTADLSKWMGEIEQRLINAESVNAVLKETIQNLLASSTGKQVSLIRAELDKAVAMTSEPKLVLLQRK